jgi:hypothetical protein
VGRGARGKGEKKKDNLQETKKKVKKNVSKQ